MVYQGDFPLTETHHQTCVVVESQHECFSIPTLMTPSKTLARRAGHWLILIHHSLAKSSYPDG